MSAILKTWTEIEDIVKAIFNDKARELQELTEKEQAQLKNTTEDMARYLFQLQSAKTPADVTRLKEDIASCRSSLEFYSGIAIERLAFQIYDVAYKAICEAISAAESAIP